VFEKCLRHPNGGLRPRACVSGANRLLETTAAPILPARAALGGCGLRQRRLRAREAGRGWLGWVGKEGRGEPVFTRVLQDIEGHCLGCVRRVLQSEGWPVRSWQQKGLLEEDANEWKAAAGRGSGGGEPTM
jgi:hypothetical protein